MALAVTFWMMPPELAVLPSLVTLKRPEPDAPDSRSPAFVAFTIVPPLMVTGAAPPPVMLTPLGAQLVETVAKVTPFVPMVRPLVTKPLPDVVEMVLLGPAFTSTVSVPLVPLAENAAPVVVVRASPPLVNAIVPPACPVIVTAALVAAVMVFVELLNVIVPALQLLIRIPVPVLVLMAPENVSVPHP